MKTKNLIYGWVVLLLVSCAGPQVRVPVPERKFLFPYGTYNHSISLKLSDRRNYHFKGVVDLREKSLQVVGLSFFNTTVFRLKEDRVTGKLDVEIFQEQLKKYEDKIRQFYANLRMLLILESHPKRSKGVETVKSDEDGYPAHMRFLVADKEVEVYFNTYDAKKIPERIEIARPEFSVDLVVTSYEI